MNIFRPVAIAVAGAALTLGVACSSSSPAASSGSQPVAQQTDQRAVPTSATIAQLTTADIVKLAEPAVVRIETGSGVGTGFVVAQDGYIITNNHVVQTTSTVRGRTSGIKVTMSDGSEYQATLVGADTRSDIAVIKIDATGLTPLKIGSLDNTVVGQDVVAIGFALDLKGGEGPSYTVTRGIVSAKNRAIAENSAILGAIQTDAAINHGNSGGPLLNLAGEVIGVNTAIAPDGVTGAQAPGIGFAVGADTVKAVFEQIRSKGKVNRGLLGIQGFEALRPAKAKELGLPAGTRGVYLSLDNAVAAGGPAATAGIKTSDVITKVAEFPIRDESDLAIAMIRHQPGDQVDVELFRGSKQMTVQVTLGTPSAQ